MRTILTPTTREGLPRGWESLDARGLSAATSVLMLALEYDLGDKLARDIAYKLAAKTISAYQVTLDHFGRAS